MTSLANLLAPTLVDSFIRDHLDQHTMKFVNGTPAKFSSLIDWTSFSSALDLIGVVRPEAIVLRRSGVNIPLPSYTRSRPGHPYSKTCTDPQKVEDYLREGATLVVNRIDETHQPLRRLCAEIELLLQRSVWANAYAVWGGLPGGSTHFDRHDVIILQVYGRKQWKVYQPTIPFPLGEPAVGSGPQGHPVWDGYLVAGDVLFVPRGWWHLPSPCGEPTLHITLGIERVCGLDLLRRLADMLEDSEIMRRNVPSGEQARRSYLDRWCATVTDAIQNRPLTQAAASFFYPPSSPFDLASVIAHKLLDPALVITAEFASGGSSSLNHGPEGCDIVRHREVFRYSHALFPLLWWLHEASPLRVGAFRSQFIESWGARKLDELLADLAGHDLISLRDDNDAKVDLHGLCECH